MKPRADVSPITNLRQRLEDYHAERRQFWLREKPMQLLFIIAICYLVCRFAPFPAGTGAGTFLVMVAFIALPLVFVGRPRRPTEADVELDRALRRSSGMDDSVAP